MPESSDPLARLTEVMTARRLQLGMRTWRNLAEAAGISPETLRALRAGEGQPTDSTIHGLNRALCWKDGAGVEALLAGGEPTLAEVAEAKPSVEEQVAELSATVVSLQKQLDKLMGGGQRNNKAG